MGRIDSGQVQIADELVKILRIRRAFPAFSEDNLPLASVCSVQSHSDLLEYFVFAWWFRYIPPIAVLYEYIIKMYVHPYKNSLLVVLETFRQSSRISEAYNMFVYSYNVYTCN